MVVSAHPAREAAAKDQILGALRICGGEERGQGAALRPAADDSSVHCLCPHDGKEVLHPRVQRWRRNASVRCPVPRLSKWITRQTDPSRSKKAAACRFSQITSMFCANPGRPINVRFPEPKT